jgi:hypothetical protein
MSNNPAINFWSASQGNNEMRFLVSAIKNIYIMAAISDDPARAYEPWAQTIWRIAKKTSLHKARHVIADSGSAVQNTARFLHDYIIRQSGPACDFQKDDASLGALSTLPEDHAAAAIVVNPTLFQGLVRTARYSASDLQTPHRILGCTKGDVSCGIATFEFAGPWAGFGFENASLHQIICPDMDGPIMLRGMKPSPAPITVQEALPVASASGRMGWLLRRFGKPQSLRADH